MSSSDSNAAEELPEAATHTKWKHGDFEIVSSDNVRFCVEHYYFQAWSMLATGSGTKRITVPELSITIDQLLDLITTGNFDLLLTDAEGCSTALIQLSHLAKFMNKYDCPVAKSVLLRIVRERRDLPLVALLLSEIPAHPKYFIEKLKTYTDGEANLWLPPNKTSLKPKDVPVQAFAELPIGYHWALKLSNIGNLTTMLVQGGEGKQMGPDERFSHFLAIAKAAGHL